jgi:hypothetical protein
MEYVRTGTWLYGDSPRTFTYCQEEYKSAGLLSAWQLLVGGGSGSGLCLSIYYSAGELNGVGGVRKF